jgi:hypothetical protein
MGLITWINEFREFPRYSDFLLNLQGHIVILGFNEVGVELAEFYRARKTDVLCIDLDPDLYDTFLQAYKGTKPKAPGKLPPSLRLRGTSRLGSRSLPRPAEVLPSMPFANLGFPRQVSAVPSQALYSPVPVNMSNIPIVGRAFGMHTSDDEASEYEIGETSIISAQNFGNMPFPGFPMFPYPDIQAQAPSKPRDPNHVVWIFPFPRPNFILPSLFSTRCMAIAFGVCRPQFLSPIPDLSSMHRGEHAEREN